MKNYKVPKDYRKLLEFVHSNRNQLTTDNSMVINILSTLDGELKNARNMSDLHMDSNIILSTVKIQQDGLQRMFRSNLSLPMLIEMYEKGHLGSVFDKIKQRSLVTSVVDQVSLSYNAKSRPEYTRQARRYNGTAEEAYCPAKVEETFAEETSNELEKIKSVVTQQGNVEYFRLVLDPSSYGKSVRNVFNVALAIRSKYVVLVKSAEQIFVAPYVYTQGEAGHSVVEMTYERYKRLCDRLNISDALL